MNNKEITGAIDLHSTGDIINELGDAAGANKLIVKDSGAVEVAAIDSDGNITTSGTVDGRDVAADGSQMDAYLSQGIGTGVRNGGLLTVNGGDNTKFDISDGTGYIVDCYTTPGTPTVTEVSWTGKTAITITNLATNLITFVSIDSGGNVIQRTSRWTPAQSRDEIVLGVVVHVNKLNADTTNDEQHTSLDAISQVYDLCEGLGFFNIDGNEFTADGANLFLQKADGNMFARGANFKNNAKQPHKLNLPVLSNPGVGIDFQYRFSDGSNGVTGKSVDPDNLDDLAGGLTALGNNKWAIHRIYSFTSNNVKMQRGQTEYDSKAEALAAIQTETFVTEPSIAANGLLRAFLILQKGATDLSDSSTALFIDAGKFGTTSGAGGGEVTSLQKAYDNSSTPEITTSTLLGALSLKRGSGADTDDVFEVQNGAGSQVMAVTGQGNLTLSGTVDGRDIATDGTKLDGIASGAIANVVEDTTPQLGGGLDVNGNEITGAIDLHSTGDIIQELGDAAGTNKVSIRDSAGVEQAAIDSDGNITTNGTVDGRDVAADGALAASAMQDLVDDTTPQLGGDLDGNNFSVKNIDDLTIDEAADHTTTPAAGFSTIWVRNDTPTTLMHSDDAGNDYELHPPFAVVPFLTDVGATTVSCSSTDKLLNDNGVLTSIDMTRFTQARITVVRGGTARTGLIIGVRYNATLSLTYGDYSAMGASATDVEVSCPSANTAYASSWIDITSAARDDVAIACYQRNVSVTGNAGFVRILLELR